MQEEKSFIVTETALKIMLEAVEIAHKDFPTNKGLVQSYLGNSIREHQTEDACVEHEVEEKPKGKVKKLKEV